MPGMYGLEAGQSAVGDIFNWFVKQLAPAEYGTGGDGAREAHRRRREAAARRERACIALDWNNGNRTILVDPLLTGLLVGQTLHTTAPEIYRALVEATAFGALTIINRFEEYGVQGRGGDQLRRHRREESVRHADLRRRVQPADEDQPLGADMCAWAPRSSAPSPAGAYANVEAAQAKMTGVKDDSLSTRTPSNAADVRTAVSALPATARRLRQHRVERIAVRRHERADRHSRRSPQGAKS